MADIFVNPNLPNYFMEVPEVTSAENARSLVTDYEAAKVITFPNLKLNFDPNFWATLDTDRFPNLKKFRAAVHPEDYGNVDVHRVHLNALGIPADLVEALCDQFRAIYEVLIPAYLKIFSDYEFDSRRKVVWRLNTIMNENMHVDTYKEENEQHFARMFVNLDTQPRIWQTSWTADDIAQKLRGRFPAEDLGGKSRGEVWMMMNSSVFGKTSREWWDNQPRHVAYFAPGDVWIVDSRQVAHQIFYGRRALSIDFSLPKEQMKNPDRHYLEIADRFRNQVVEGLAA